MILVVGKALVDLSAGDPWEGSDDCINGAPSPNHGSNIVDPDASPLNDGIARPHPGASYDVSITGC